MGRQAWEVVGGASKGGIVVRTSREVASPQEPDRLSTGAVVIELEQADGRLNFQRVTGTGPDIGWVSMKLETGKDLLVHVENIWEVVGGADKGGIVVREGQDVSSAQESERLSTGAFIRQLDLEGERLHYERLTGRGPRSGWVSIRLQSGKELVEHRNSTNGIAATPSTVQMRPPIPFQAKMPLKASELGPQAKAELEVNLESFTQDYYKRLASGVVIGPLETYVQRFTAGEVKGGAPGRPEQQSDDGMDTDFEARRRKVAAVRETYNASIYKSPPPFIRLSKKDLLKKAPQMMNGDIYGLPVPPTLSELQTLGAGWLTKAFRAAEAIGQDNAVTKVVEFIRLPTTTVSAAGGAGPKAILTVEYQRPDPSLHCKLFAKLPWAVEGESKEMGVDVNNRVGQSVADDYQELAVYRFMGELFPFKVPRYYYADICRENSNSILITEAIQFGKKGEETSEPYKIMPLAEKYFDFQLGPQQQVDIYYCLMRNQARLAAWYQLGFFDKLSSEVIGAVHYPPLSFPWPPKMPAKQREGRKRGAVMMRELWTEFIGLAKCCYPSELTEPDFQAALGACVEDFATFDGEVRQYFNLFPEYIALQHPNLNADNAFFWRDAQDRMDCGIFDWGGAAPMNCVMCMTGSLTGAEGEVQDEHDVSWLQCFRDEYHRECGIKLDLGEMRRQWHLTYGIYLIYLAMRIRDAVFVQTPQEEWKTIRTLWDKRAIEKWNVRCYTFMIGLAMRYLYIRWVRGGRKRLHIHETFVEWHEHWTRQGME